MSLETCFGREQNLFLEDQEHAARLVAPSPVLTWDRFRQLLEQTDPRYAHQRIDLNYPRELGLRAALAGVCDQAVAAVQRMFPYWQETGMLLTICIQAAFRLDGSFFLVATLIPLLGKTEGNWTLAAANSC